MQFLPILPILIQGSLWVNQTDILPIAIHVRRFLPIHVWRPLPMQLIDLNTNIFELVDISAQHSELKKMGSTGSMLPELPRFSPGTHKASNYLKDVWIAKCSVEIARFSSSVCSIELLGPVVHKLWVPITLRLKEYIPFVSKSLRNRKIIHFCSRNASALFSALNTSVIPVLNENYNTSIWNYNISMIPVLKAVIPVLSQYWKL